MKMLVLGAGLQGCACAFDLLRSEAVERVTLADVQAGPLPRFLDGAGERLRRARLDAREARALARALEGQDAVLCALPYYFNAGVTRAAIAAGVHSCDLGGNTEIVFEQKRLDGEARARGVSALPDCGLAPGMVNVLAAEAIARLDQAESVRVYVGGLPQHPEPPLDYQVVYSLEGVLDYYTTPSWVLRDGEPAQVEALSEVETLAFPAPVGELEAFHTAGGISTMPWTHRGRIRALEYKTLRYPGHARIVRAMRDLGLFDKEPVDVGGQRVAPRDVFIAVARPRLTRPGGEDLVALRVVARGRRGGAATEVGFQVLDLHDREHGISAMMRTTGYSLSITAQMQVDGRIAARGVHTPDEAVPFGPYVEELARRGIRVEER